ncbi:MAG: hypothetical protein V2I53_14455, partial [Paracoccaceae bacterium]|nr:hypothetical protein [Paracoccaceae bacterium]
AKNHDFHAGTLPKGQMSDFAGTYRSGRRMFWRLLRVEYVFSEGSSTFWSSRRRKFVAMPTWSNDCLSFR